ncbi:MAG: shikimate kinase [Leptolyngbya sp. SIO1E4]|nr:shikimate kinase [Leptolyngbya sp. SIO1E4]
MMGVGKSTLGPVMASRLGYRFLDTDSLIEQAAAQPIPAIFQSAGEAEFRTLESQVLGQLSSYTRLVVATGGGIVLRPENWGYLQQGVIVWINVPVEELQRRLQGDSNRPLLQRQDWPQHLANLLESRRHLYAEADIHLSVAAGESTEVICDRLISHLEDRILPPPSVSINADSINADD